MSTVAKVTAEAVPMSCGVERVSPPLPLSAAVIWFAVPVIHEMRSVFVIWFEELRERSRLGTSEESAALFETTRSVVEALAERREVE